jgi:hypothetical protein
MKKSIPIIVILLVSYSYAQSVKNDYKAVIVPLNMISKGENQYRLVH